MTPGMPTDRAPDSTLLLWRQGYRFIPRRVQRYGSDVFKTRLLLQPIICMTGADAAQVFYDEEQFQRADAAPLELQKTLFGQGGVQSLDGDAHRHRKALFMSLMTPASIERLGQISERHWVERRSTWERAPRVILLDEAHEVLARSVCEWSGIPLAEDEVRDRTSDLVALFEGAGTSVFAHVRARLARKRSEDWMRDLVRRVRDGSLRVQQDSALAAVAHHRDLDGGLLDERVAAVELLNVLRPTTAVGRYVVFTALALHSFTEQRARLDSGDCEPEWFVQEVRRLYPFFPFVAARVRKDFDWAGHRFEAGTRTLLDLYGTTHDERVWPAPHRFDPERFRSWDGNRYTLIPQGGGDHLTGHRCAGEWITIELMKVALRFLTTSVRYDVPPQDLRLPLSRIPTTPNSRFVLSNVRLP